jgi:hypothetical protein
VRAATSFADCSLSSNPACAIPVPTVTPCAQPWISPTKALAITDEASPFALRSTRNRLRTAMHQGADVNPEPVVTGDAEVFLRRVRLISVSNLSARFPRHAMRTRTSPRPVSADELGRCGAEHGGGRQCVGAALASHGRGHRFETCHAHQHKRLLQPTPQGRLPADCQQTTLSRP